MHSTSQHFKALSQGQKLYFLKKDKNEYRITSKMLTQWAILAERRPHSSQGRCGSEIAHVAVVVQQLFGALHADGGLHSFKPLQ